MLTLPSFQAAFARSHFDEKSFYSTRDIIDHGLKSYSPSETGNKTSVECISGNLDSEKGGGADGTAALAVTAGGKITIDGEQRQAAPSFAVEKISSATDFKTLSLSFSLQTF